MFNRLTKRLGSAVLFAGLVLPAAAFAAPASSAAPPAPAVAAPDTIVQAPVTASDEETIANFKKILADYGNFVTLPQYGDVWVPTVTPQGWHPYPPCHWIYAKDVGWYFRDNTPWGAIVHHYGRWSHDAKIGWFWVPDANWSPGWVVWRNSDQWTGWAPMPPDLEAQNVSLGAFDEDKMWIFMETPKFVSGCGDTVVASSVYNETSPVTLFELPAGHIVDVHIVPRWKIKVIRRIVVIDRVCPPRRPHDPPIGHRPRQPQPTLYQTLQPSPRAEAVPLEPLPHRRHHIRFHHPHRTIEVHQVPHVVIKPHFVPRHDRVRKLSHRYNLGESGHFTRLRTTRISGRFN
ncbi:MAG TPA: DUF6600 domain-containing protein [Pseudolabrys sp.]|nr:DUF6600 domain-containing protein [Pseudolabrys sp.]